MILIFLKTIEDMLNLLQNKSNESGGLNMGLLLGVKMG
jgi:hypothetical protein